MSNCLNCLDILTIEEVSDLLQCSQDTIRRTPRDQLPTYRVGKVNIYLRDDVIRYVMSRRVQSTNIDGLLAEVESAVVQPAVDGVRGRSQRRMP